MALSIGVSTGSRIDVGGHMVRVKSITYPNLIVLLVDELTEFVVSDQDRKEILPRVFVQSGVGKTGGINRLAFEAPREIRISRIEEPRK